MLATGEMYMDTDKASHLGRCHSCIIRHKGLCGALKQDELLQFRKIANRRVFKPGENILQSDDDPDFFAAVISGVVKLTKVLFDGRQQVVDLLLPIDCLGQVFGRRSSYYAQAASDVELCCFPYSGFEQMLEEFPDLKHRFLEQTLDDLESARNWMVLLGRKTAEERVASLLLMLATRSAITNATDDEHARPVALDLHLKRHEIADFLGLTYETVCRQFTALKNRGLIQQSSRRRFSIPDPEALTRAAG
jgi:CRP/FNR family transcriptional regulator